MLPGLGLQRALALLGLAAALRPRSNLSAAHWSHLHPANMLSSCKVDRLYHSKALTSPYPGSRVERSRVPEDKVGWLTQWEDYNPVEYTAAAVLAGPKWADPQINDKNFTPKFNERDGEVERTSRNGLYVVENGRPRNPTGRTGLTGRGLLGRWGPNHAADPIVTRWKRDGSGNKIAHPVTGKNILQFVAIKRRDCGEWAIPGGMVDPGEKISATLKREFGEEALNSLQKSPEEKASLEKQLQRLFSQEHFVVYRGYVDDPRNTDNAWMETEAVNYHDETENTSPEQTYFRGGSQITTSGADALRRGTFSGVCSRFSRSSLLFPVLPISSVTHDSILYIVLTQLAERSK